jgi:hypothetical protein
MNICLEWKENTNLSGTWFPLQEISQQIENSVCPFHHMFFRNFDWNWIARDTIQGLKEAVYIAIGYKIFPLVCTNLPLASRIPWFSYM